MAFAAALATCLTSGLARATDEGAAPSRPAAATTEALPRYIEQRPPEPDAAARARLGALLAALVSSTESERLRALEQLRNEVDATWLSAAAERFERLASGSDKLALKAELEKVRDRARAEIARSLAARGGGEVVTPDYLEMLIRHPHRAGGALVPLTEVVACSRIFERIGSLPAARALVTVYVRFGEFLRVDTQLALARLGDRAVAALIEAKAHPVPRIASWANKQLAALGRGEPADAVAVVDPGLRADILRAYGKIRDLDSVRLLISYAASERALTRLAARQALAAMGEVALWPLRDAYEKTVGKRAAHEWPWERLARELFAELDRVRLAEIYADYERGQKARDAGDLVAARAAFDRVLTRSPEFEHGADLAAFYLDFAGQTADASAHDAILALRRTERLATDETLRNRALSLRHTLEAELAFAEGVIDEVLLRRAGELDPDNARLSALIERVSSATPAHGKSWIRYLTALGVALVAAVGLSVVLLRAYRTRFSKSASTS